MVEESAEVWQSMRVSLALVDKQREIRVKELQDSDRRRLPGSGEGVQGEERTFLGRNSRRILSH